MGSISFDGIGINIASVSSQDPPFFKTPFYLSVLYVFCVSIIAEESRFVNPFLKISFFFGFRPAGKTKSSPAKGLLFTQIS
jgi:hypothetical protein